MTRPVYERQHDRDREAEVARQIAHRWEAKCLMMPKFSAADMLIIDQNDKPQCWAEIKSRNITFGSGCYLPDRSPVKALLGKKDLG